MRSLLSIPMFLPGPMLNTGTREGPGIALEKARAYAQSASSHKSQADSLCLSLLSITVIKQQDQPGL